MFGKKILPKKGKKEGIVGVWTWKHWQEGTGMGCGGLPPEKFLRTAPSRTSENAFLEHRVKIAIIVAL